jgi:GNAT superfamily N-acetyltransferase
MQLTIRTVRLEDAAPVVAFTGVIDTTSFATAASFRALLERGAPEGTERLVAEVDGVVVAWAPSGMHADGSGWLWIGVDAAYRRRGIGAALYERIEARLAALGATPLRTQINDDAGRAFVERRGFARTNVLRMQALDLRSADLPEPTVETLPLRSIEIDSLFPLYASTHADIPSRSPRPPVAEGDFRREVSESQLIDLDASRLVLEDGEPVAFTLVLVNREQRRAGAQMTGVRRDRRGRGLAYAVKLASLRKVREAGFETMLTANDLENAPMLAVNRRLGFEASVLIEDYEKGNAL